MPPLQTTLGGQFRFYQVTQGLAIGVTAGLGLVGIALIAAILTLIVLIVLRRFENKDAGSRADL